MPRPPAGGSAALLFTLASLAGCASLPENVPREPSHALADPGSTAVGRWVAAHAGYEKRRKTLLEAGVELFELRPDSGPAPIDQSVVTARSKAALHTKAFVFDRQSIFVGSFNLDPRSASINTEFGLYLASPALAADLAAFMNEDVAPDSAYRVVLDDDGDGAWIEQRADGTGIRHDKEPRSSFWQHFGADVLKLLPIESQL